MDEFESPEVQKDFPGLYTPGPSKGKKEDSEFSSDTLTKKDKKKDKKDKEKGYATLAGGDSSPEEEETKSPSKSTKRIKAFKFPLKKEKREKSRDKDQAPPSTKKEKEKKDKKAKPTQGNEEPQELGDLQPIFGVPLHVSVERSRCHDLVNLPLVVRHCIDFLQDGTMNEGVYKGEPAPKESKIQQLKKLYNNRESNGPQDLENMVTAAALLKTYLVELPEPVLTTELISQFEEASANSDVQEQEAHLMNLVEKLPPENQVLLKWLSLHWDWVTGNENINAQSLAVLLSPILQTSHRLFVTILCHCRSLFLPGGTSSTKSDLPKYIPPLTGANPTLPESREGILMELAKQESLLSEIHREMNSGFVKKRTEEQLWEVQRIITQLKRKLRQVEKKCETQQKSVEDTVDSGPTETRAELATSKSIDETSKSSIPQSSPPSSKEEQAPSLTLTITESGFLALPPDHPEANLFTQLQWENYELHRLRQKLQLAINQEKAEIHAMKKLIVDGNRAAAKPIEPLPTAAEAQELLAQNAYLESVRKLLCEEITAEQKRVVDLRVKLCMAGVS